MSSLSRFKQRLNGEQVVKEEPHLDEWLKLVTEIDAEKTDQDSIVEEINIIIDNEEPVAEEDEIDIMVELESMSKEELDIFASEHGIQLDRRKSKQKMITEFIQKLEENN